MDIGCLLAHGCVRTYVMGERGGQVAPRGTKELSLLTVPASHLFGPARLDCRGGPPSHPTHRKERQTMFSDLTLRFRGEQHDEVPTAEECAQITDVVAGASPLGT